MGRIDDDNNARNRIVSDINSNFFVEAGAGSGKTTMLVNRMVAMIEAGIDITSISAITFTKAAAREFYDRFQSILIQRSDPGSKWKTGKPGQLPEPTDKTRDLCDYALKNIDLCFMGTIDAFCNMVLSEHPSEAGLLSDSHIVTDAEADAIYRQVYVDVCNGKHGKDLQSLSNTFRAVNSRDQEVFRLGMRYFMGHRHISFRFTPAPAVDIDKDFADVRKELIKTVKCLKEHPEIIRDKNKSPEAYAEIDEIIKAVNSRWSANLNDLLYKLKTLSKIEVNQEAEALYGSELSPFFVIEGKRPPKLACTGVKDGLLKDLENLKYNASVTFLTKCIDIVEKEMHDSGVLTFFDGLYYLRNTLREDAENGGKLINYINSRHSYFLIDEFQDTNPIQAEIFFYLSSKSPVSKWYECKPSAGSLFIVGDPKQSIYRFNDADVASYLRVKNLFKADEILELTQNFRTKRGVINYFNAVFKEMLQEDTENHNQSKFEEIPLPNDVPDEFQGMFKYSIADANEDPGELAEIVKKLVNNDHYQIRSKDEEDEDGNAPLRPIRYKDIMIITYGKDYIAEIMPEFTKNKIPMKVEGQVLFKTNEAFLELYRIYAAVVDNYDGVALYGVLTGKTFALTRDELIEFRSCGGVLSLSFDPDEEDYKKEASKNESAKKVEKVLSDLSNLRERSRRMSSATLLAYVLDECRIYGFADTENMEVVYYALELMKSAEKSRVVTTLREGKIFLEDLMGDDSEVERCLSLADKEDRVRLANLHKIKGLEAPVVILAKAQKNNNPTVTHWIEREGDSVTGYLISLKKKRGEKGTHFNTNEYDEKKNLEKEAMTAEEVRKVYVAATRARNALIINSYGDWRNVWGALLNDMVVEFESAVTEEPSATSKPAKVVEAAELYKKAQDSFALNSQAKVQKSTYTHETPSGLALVSKTDSTDVTTEVVMTTEPEVDETRMFASVIGTMTHKLMEELVSSRGKIDCSKAIYEIISEHRTAKMIPYVAEIIRSLETVAKTITAGGYAQNNGLPQDILKTLLDAEEVYCEVPFGYKEELVDETVIWNGIMDVIYCSGGKWHIVDYKTNADGSDLDNEYQNQLNAYIKAFKEITGNDADAKTYHIDV